MCMCFYERLYICKREVVKIEIVCECVFVWVCTFENAYTLEERVCVCVYLYPLWVFHSWPVS